MHESTMHERTLLATHESTIHQEAFKQRGLNSNVRVSPEAFLAQQCFAMYESTIPSEPGFSLFTMSRHAQVLHPPRHSRSLPLSLSPPLSPLPSFLSLSLSLQRLLTLET